MKSINILGREFKIQKVSEAEIKRRTGHRHAPEAALQYSSRIILIRKGLTPHEERLSLYHEVGHAIMRTTGISQVVNPEVQEIICESFASGFTDLVKTN